MTDTVPGPSESGPGQPQLQPTSAEPRAQPELPGPPLPTDRWLALAHGPGTMGWADGAVELKHTWAEPGPDGRVYFHAGDFSGDAVNQSNRQDLWAFDLRSALAGPAGAGWTVEHPYCGEPPLVQPKHPDKVSIAWDARRGIHWAFPGSAEINTQPSDLCSGETARRASDLRFPWHAVMFWTPRTKQWTLYDANPGPGFARNEAGGYENVEGSTYSIYDEASDSLVRFSRGPAGARAVHYHIPTRTYRTSGSFGEIYINQNYLAYDPAERAIYVIDAIADVLYRYDIAGRSLRHVVRIPGGPFPTSSEEWPLVRFDTRNRLVLFFRLHAPRGFFAYSVMRRKWETMSLVTTVPGVEADGLMLWYEPTLDFIGLMGGTPVERGADGRPTGRPSGTRYLFVTRYAGPAPLPPR